MGRPQPLDFIFDLDGTLVDSAPGIASALAAAFASIGRAIPETDIRSVIGPPIRVIAKRLDPALTDDQTLAIERVYRPLYDRETWRQTTLYPDADATLRTLHAGGSRLFVATNKPLVPTTLLLEHLELAPLFTGVLTRDSQSPPYASKADMLAHLIRLHGIDPATAMMVGDTAEDGEAAAHTGVEFAFMTHGYGQLPAGAQPFHSFPALLAHFEIKEQVPA